MSLRSQSLPVCVALSLIFVPMFVEGQAFIPAKAVNRTKEGRASFFDERGSFRGRKYITWARKWYDDAMLRIDKQIQDDEEDGDPERNPQLEQYCRKAGKVSRAVCETFGREAESCKVTQTEFNQKCVPNAGSDPFFFVWFCTQQLYAATELAPNDPFVFAQAAEMGLNLHRSPDGPVIFLQQTLGYMSRACRLDTQYCDRFAKMIEDYARNDRIGNLRDQDFQMVKHQVRALKSKADGTDERCCDTPPGTKHDGQQIVGGPSRDQDPDPEGLLGKDCCLIEQISEPLPRVDDIMEVSLCDEETKKCREPQQLPDSVDYARLSPEVVQTAVSTITSRAVWPTWISSLNLGLPVSFHKKLTRLAIRKYAQFSKQEMRRQGATHLDVNNAFFSRQVKSEHEATGNAIRFWPELYQESPEWRALFRFSKEACIQHILKNGRGQTREYLEGLTLILWAAVYTTSTSHNTHMHEQSLCSGTYYSNAPPDSMPLILSDPRGGQPMHTDMAKIEAEPEAPFHHQVSFFPKAGDMLLFPSYMPHHVPAATENEEPRVVWAYNLEGGVDSYARMSGIKQ